MGTPDFAVPSLEILLKNGYEIRAVVTGPDKPRGRGQEILPTPVKQVAERHTLAIFQPPDLGGSAFADQIRHLCPDLIVVVAFRILPKAIFSIPRLGAFNLHASLLPKYRGAAPINWALMRGEEETGVTTFLLQENVDTGNILLQARVAIQDFDDAGTLHDTLAKVGAEIVLHSVRLLETGKANPRAQVDSDASLAPKIRKDDCRIRWDQTARDIHNRIRGLSPSPTAFSVHNNRVLKLYRSRLLDDPSKGPPGELVVTDRTVHVSTRDRMLSIVEIQQEGRKRMGVDEFLRGYRMKSGEKFV
jgi:methionyl-tRNA formyltransferase